MVKQNVLKVTVPTRNGADLRVDLVRGAETLKSMVSVVPLGRISPSPPLIFPSMSWFSSGFAQGSALSPDLGPCWSITATGLFGSVNIWDLRRFLFVGQGSEGGWRGEGKLLQNCGKNPPVRLGLIDRIPVIVIFNQPVLKLNYLALLKGDGKIFFTLLQGFLKHIPQRSSSLQRDLMQPPALLFTTQ